jgi:hypothetical protein
MGPAIDNISEPHEMRAIRKAAAAGGDAAVARLTPSPPPPSPPASIPAVG